MCTARVASTDLCTSRYPPPYNVGVYRMQLECELDIACKHCHGNGRHVVLNFAAWHEGLVTWVANCRWLPVPHIWQRLQHAVATTQASSAFKTALLQHANLDL